MKRFYFLLLILSVACLACTDTTTEDVATDYTISLEKSSTMTNLPALQSFVVGKTDTHWLLIGGRTNGFHGFSGASESFPFKKANQFIYAYEWSTNTLDSVSVDLLPEALREQYTSSNMQHFQEGNYLYINGGYGEVNAGTADSAWHTYSTLSRVTVDEMVSSITTNDEIAISSAVVYDDSEFVRATGGELYRMPNKEFYLAVGQNFEGRYSASDTTVYKQSYLDSVHVFKINETGSSISVDQTSLRYISDNYVDPKTNFRRRDLVVVPAVVDTEGTINLTAYGGVFTSPDTTYYPGFLPFRNPIYLDDSEKGYEIDSSYIQTSNIYAAPTVLMYSKSANTMHTAILGGMGIDTVSLPDQFTQGILKIKRALSSATTTESLNANSMPDYLGAEADFMLAESAHDLLFDDAYGIYDFDKIPVGEKVLLGYFYGGILSNAQNWNATTNPTMSSNAVYEVYVTAQ
jgi:hypothetical protein